MGGPVAPREWQGALPFSYHVGGAGLIKVHLRLKMDYAERTIWDVIGKIPGAELPDEWVVEGNHRCSLVFGSVDPSSGTVAMLEAVHGIGALLAQGWKPRRTILFCSWDAEEAGLIGSTEWAEEHAKQLAHAVVYINTDASVSGIHFEASAVPSLKQFIREVTTEVVSPKGGSVYDEWKKDLGDAAARRHPGKEFNDAPAVPLVGGEVRVGDLGSGSDYTPFIQHLGVPSTDIGSTGAYGVYHSVFEDYTWFTKFADPTFVYEQQQARVFGLEVLHMADADVLPYDYDLYGKEVVSYVEAAQRRATTAGLKLDFSATLAAAHRFAAAGIAVHATQE